MANLKGRAMPSRLQRKPSRLASRAVPVIKQAPRRSKGWLNTARWQRLRLEILARDGYVCQQTGEALVGKYPAPNSPVVDHIKAHRGDPDLFWDKTNLQSVSKRWHDRVKQALEKTGRA